MCEIIGLEISGIRSFSYDRTESIEFTKPFTLILGDNGSGKTSIIESLKFITTGEFPPDSKRGKHYFNDIKLLNIDKAKSEVRLIFKSMRYKETITAERTNYIYLKNNKIQAKSNSQTIKIQGSIKTSYDVEDFNDYMSNLLLTPSSIIDKVCFAHQEDQEWLLDNNNECLTKIFDEFFYTEKLSNAVKLISKEINHYPSLTKDVEQDIHLMKINLEEYNSVSEEFNLTKKNLDISKELTGQSLKEMEVLRSKIPSEKLARKNELDSMKRVYYDVLEKYKGYNDLPQEELHEFLYLNIVELEKKREFILTSLSTNHNNLLECTQKLDHIKISNKQNIDYELQISYKKELEKLDQMLKEMLLKAIHLNLLSSHEISTKEGNDFKFTLASKLVADNYLKKQEYETNKELHLERINSLLLEETSKRNEIKDLISTKELKEKEIDVIKNLSEKQTYNQYELKLTEINNEITNNKKKIEEWTISLYKINTDIKEDPFINEEENEKMRIEIDNLEQIKSCNEAEIRSINKELVHLELELNKMGISYQILDSENEKSFSSVLDNESKMLEKLKIDFEVKKEEIKILEVQFSHTKQDLSKIEFSEEKIVQLLEDLELLGIQFENNLIDVGETAKLNQIIAIKNKIQAEDRKYQSLMKFYEFLVSQTGESNSCIMCNSDMSKNKNIDLNFIKSQIDPCQVKNSEEILNLLEKLQSELNKKIHYNKLRTEESTIIEKLKSARLEDRMLYKQINEKEKTIELLTLKKTKIVEFCNLKSIVGEKLKIKLNLIASNKECEQRLNNLSQEHEKANILILDIKQKNKEKQELIEFISLGEKTRNKLESEKAFVMKELNHLIELMPKTIEKAEKELEEINQKLGKCKREMIKIVNMIDEIKKEINKVTNEIMACSNNLEFILSLDRVCKDYKHFSENIVNINFEEIENISNEIKELTKMKSVIEGEIRKKQEDLEVIEDEIAKTKEKIDLKEKFSEYFSAINELKNIEKEKEENKEIFAEIEKDLKNIKLNEELFEKGKSEVEFLQNNHDILEGKLKSDKFADICKKFHLKKLDLIVLNQQRLHEQKLRDVLVSQISYYHNKQLDKINATINKIWSDICKDSDIRGIFIHRDCSSFSEKKVTSSYRIDFKLRNNDEEMLELKGRGSAGQKVLICTIVRIALCLLFGSQFPVIALDEPTKNLDYENTMALADCLRELVKCSNENFKFQFIIITHDQDFIKRLGYQICQKYYHVSKDSLGYSQIIAKDI